MLTYTELSNIDTYVKRLEYLRVTAPPSELTFGVLRHMNQKFYASKRWKAIRDYVIARDLGYDLAIPGREIRGRILVHHMNPLTPKDLYAPDLALDPEFLITVSNQTHLGIHFGAEVDIPLPSARRPGDTKLW